MPISTGQATAVKSLARIRNRSSYLTYVSSIRPHYHHTILLRRSHVVTHAR